MSEIGQNQLAKDVFWGIMLTACLTAAALCLPIGFVIGLLIPLPLIFYRIKVGRLSSGIILCTVLAIVWMTFGNKGAQCGVFFLYFGLTGVTLAEACVRNLSVEKTVLIPVGVVLGAGAILLFAYKLFAPESLEVLTKTYLRENIEFTIALYKDMGVSLDKIEILQNSVESILYIFIYIIPGIFAAFTLFTVWANLLMTRSILQKRNLFCPDFGSLNRWKSPEHLVWIAIGSGFLLLFPVSGLKILGLNGLIVLVVVYMFQGLAIISYYFEKKKFPLLLRGLVYTLVAVQQLLVIVVILAGFLDVWVDFRRLKGQQSN